MASLVKIHIILWALLMCFVVPAKANHKTLAQKKQKQKNVEHCQNEILVLKNKNHEENDICEAYKLDQRPSAKFYFDRPSKFVVTTIKDNNTPQDKTPGMLGLGVLEEKSNGGFTFINLSSDTDSPKNDKFSIGVMQIDSSNSYVNNANQFYNPNFNIKTRALDDK
ncbi:MAG: hypothetical protein LBH49_00745 [Puniceicoccales bacterium]|jgi:hypothetical protein|nr:hypothetical protein [Puniceicoccales bacterium]